MDAKENLAFLEWRRDVAQIEEGSVNLAITPFEKNVQVWKQLWRVIEKSDLLLQVSCLKLFKRWYRLWTQEILISSTQVTLKSISTK